VRPVTTTAAALAALLLLAAPGALAKAPVLTKAGQSSGRISATWTLSPGDEAWAIEVARKRTTTRGGEFVVANVVDEAHLRSSQTSWRSRTALLPGTYYVHVSSVDDNSSIRWSNVRAVRIPGRRPPGGRYVGTTSQGQRFELVTDRRLARVTHTRYGLTLRCGGSKRTITYDLTSSLVVSGDGSFGGSFVFPAGTTLKGMFRGTSVSGTVRQDYFDGNLKTRCDSGLVRWTARRGS